MASEKRQEREDNFKMKLETPTEVALHLTLYANGIFKALKEHKRIETFDVKEYNRGIDAYYQIIAKERKQLEEMGFTDIEK